MSDNLFSFPGESAGPAGVFGDFTDLGSDDGMEDPFALPEAAEPSESAPQSLEPETGIQEDPASSLEASPDPIPGSETVPPSEEQPQTPPAQAAEESANPLLAAIDLQEQKNARQAAAPVFAQLPVFSYNGNEEPIEDIEQTFEELRRAKEEDFPEFEEAQSVSWTVTYDEISKKVLQPRKAKIGDFKREIESSKAFMDALKKSKDKRPKCILKPTVTMQKKGECAYKGVFPRLAEARASDKTISFIPARDGRVYERRVTGAGEFITPTSGVTCLDEIRAGFQPALPRIPYDLMEQALSLFRHLMTMEDRPLEALVHIYWDREEQRFFLHVPAQTVSRASVDAVLDDAFLNDERYLHYADLHSHNDMRARFSRTDDRDERANRVYMVAGRLDRCYPELAVRVCNGGHFCPIPQALVLEPAPMADFPSEWLDRIHPEVSREAAA
ncbi:MAG: hypothetical protein HFF18_06315 [Oscillospiraceae bacterium]|nr:hypothetical protein [Oscillospiraceae bacterium]